MPANPFRGQIATLDRKISGRSPGVDRLRGLAVLCMIADHLALAECNAYSPSFSPEKQAQGVPYGDPKTGKVPDEQVSTSPGASGDPGTDPGTGTDPGPAPAPGPVAGSTSCWPSGYGIFNPLSWVLQPIKCAFIPDPAAVKSALSSTWNDLRTHPPMSIVLPLFTTMTTFIGTLAHGCDGNLADFGNELQVPCDPPPGIASYITALKVLLTLALGGFTAFALWGMTERMTGHNQ